VAETARPLTAVPESKGPTLVRSDPPPKRGGRHGTTTVIESLVPELRDNAGVWFRVHTWPAKSTANSARTLLAKRHPDIEWVARVIGEGSALWAKAPEA
jgi:hypothetical protein